MEVEVTLDFTTAMNIGIDSSQEESSIIAKGIVGPMRSGVVALVRAYDVEWNTKCKITVIKRSPDSIDEQKELLKECLRRIERELDQAN